MKLFRYFSVLSAAAMCFSLCACGKPSEPETAFDETQIVLSFSAMSDVHQQDGYPLYSQKLVNALEISAQLNGGPLDLALLAGDLTENTWKRTGQAGYESKFTTEYNVEVGLLKNALSEALDLERTAVFYCLGNHDSDPSGIGGEEGEELMAQMPSLFYHQLGEEFFRFEAEDSLPEAGLRHAVVNGYHFLAVQPDNYWRLKGYSQATLDWLDGKLKEITEREPGKYVFVTAHPPAYETVWGSFAADWADSAVAEVLAKYPQAFYLSGHIHNVLNDETQISQNGSFTSVDCGGVRATGMMNHLTGVSSPEFDNAISGLHVDDFSQGLLVQLDANGNARISRIDYLTQKIIKQPWEISAPQKDGSHLAKYDNDTRAEQNKAPEFKEGAKWKVVYENGRLGFSWDAAQDDDQVRYYKIRSYKEVNGVYQRESKVYNLASFTYLYDSVEDMPASLEWAVDVSLDHGRYKFEICAVDCWDAMGKYIFTEIEV